MHVSDLPARPPLPSPGKKSLGEEAALTVTSESEKFLHRRRRKLEPKWRSSAAGPTLWPKMAAAGVSRRLEDAAEVARSRNLEHHLCRVIAAAQAHSSPSPPRPAKRIEQETKRATQAGARRRSRPHHLPPRKERRSYSAALA
jgi:hypothetical protein